MRKPWLGLALAGLLMTGGVIGPAMAEYADILLNRYSEGANVRPVVFSHWFHRIRFRCKVCHSELGFEMRAGATDVKMADLQAGRFCGTCHDGNVAWGMENCTLCHTGRMGLPTGVYGGDKTLGPGRW